MSIVVSPFGRSPSGMPVHKITMTRQQISVSLVDFGAHLASVICPDRTGKLGDVCLGFDNLTGYATHGHSYIGATVGRYANRIGGAAFTLNQKEYRLFANDGENTLHGGKEGFDKKLWTHQAEKMPSFDRVTMSYISRDGEEGFPGTLRVQVTFQLDDAARLTIAYTAESDLDTVVNLTNHAYFNLACKGDVLGHLIKIDADSVVETEDDLIPTGVLMPVGGTVYDLREVQRIGDVIVRKQEHPMFSATDGFDSCYVLNGNGMRACAWVREPVSGRELTVYTDQPGLQFYSGQGLDCQGKGGVHYGAYAGLALETQHYPDSINQPAFPSTALKAGDVYRTKTIYQFGLYR